MKKKLTKNQFRKMVREEISNLVMEDPDDQEEEEEDVETSSGQIGLQPNEKNEDPDAIGRISEDEDEYNDAIDAFATLGDDYDGQRTADDAFGFNLGEAEPKDLEAAVKRLEWLRGQMLDGRYDKGEFATAEALEREYKGIRKLAKNYFEERFSVGERFDEAKITKSVLRKMLEEEYQNVMEVSGWSDREKLDRGLGKTRGNLEISDELEFPDELEISDEEYGPSRFAEAIANLENMHGNLEGIVAVVDEAAGPNESTRELTDLRDKLEKIIDNIKALPGAPLGTDVAMSHWGRDPES